MGQVGGYCNSSIRVCLLWDVLCFRLLRTTEDWANYGSGSFVSCNGTFYLLTCCHNFLNKADGDRVSSLEDRYLMKKLKSRCKMAECLCSTRDFKGTVALKSGVVLKNYNDPVLVFDKVSNIPEFVHNTVHRVNYN